MVIIQSMHLYQLSRTQTLICLHELSWPRVVTLVTMLFVMVVIRYDCGEINFLETTNFSGSIFTVFVTSAWIVQTGTSALPVFQMPALFILDTALCQSTNPSQTLQDYPRYIAARHVTTASTVTVRYATLAMVPRPISKETDISALFATTPISVPAARPALQILIIVPIPLSSSRPRSATSV